MRDADAGSHGYRTDGPPTGARRLRVPKMRVCDERLGVKRDEPPDGSATEGTRRCRLAYLIFHPRNFQRSAGQSRHAAAPPISVMNSRRWS
jgi:hypothetical protein